MSFSHPAEVRKDCDLPGVDVCPSESACLSYSTDTVEQAYTMTRDQFDPLSDVFTINMAVTKYIQDLSQQQQELNALIIGCGAGQPVFDVAPFCEKVSCWEY